MTKSDVAQRAKPGGQFPVLELIPISGEPFSVPNPAESLSHRQFPRLVGRGVGNLRLRAVAAARIGDRRTGNIQEVVCSTVDELRKYRDDMPLVIADHAKQLYRRFDVQGTANAILNPRALPSGSRHAASETFRKERAPLTGPATNGDLGLPADILVAADGRGAATQSGEHAHAQWSIDELLVEAHDYRAQKQDRS